MDEKIKENPYGYGEGVVWLANRVAVWCQSDSIKFSGMKFFHPSVRLTIQTEPRAFVSVR